MNLCAHTFEEIFERDFETLWAVRLFFEFLHTCRGMMTMQYFERSTLIYLIGLQDEPFFTRTRTVQEGDRVRYDSKIFLQCF